MIIYSVAIAEAVTEVGTVVMEVPTVGRMAVATAVTVVDMSGGMVTTLTAATIRTECRLQLITAEQIVRTAER